MMNTNDGSLLLTDLYELTMAYGYWKNRIHEREAVFHLSFRRNPFDGGFTVACGLEAVISFLSHFHFEDEELRYLETLVGNDGKAIFDNAFLDYLSRLSFTCDVEAVPEGTVIFPHEPLLQVRGPILQAQILETILVNLIDFQTLIATKSARICLAAQGDPVVEFGLRRAQGVNGGMAASRAAYIGGCVGTSNVLAGMKYGIPIKGTHAHSWVMAFDNEEDSFDALARSVPNNCVFLVDTYDSLEGVRKAVRAGQRLRARGYEMVGIRLDSGDLAWLSIEARKILDMGGFPDAVIVASNELDEHTIASLKTQRAKIGLWGVGTRLVTGYDQPALGGVYKLSAIRGEDGRWRPCLKLSEHLTKVSNPGILQVCRFKQDGEFVGDMITDGSFLSKGDRRIIDPANANRTKTFPGDTPSEPLLVPIFQRGKQVYPAIRISESRQRTADQLKGFHHGIKRLLNPHEYPVGLSPDLHWLKDSLILGLRKPN
jgi:nicotinate phosphoribosyltransferase